MAFFDWNLDGKKDMFDDLVEYKIFEEIINEDNEEEGDQYFDDYDEE